MKIVLRSLWGITLLVAGSSVCPGFWQSQSSNFTKNFNVYKDTASGVDFYAASRADSAPFEKPVAEARRRLVPFLGTDLAPGAIVICSTLEQKDTVSEPRMLRMGYRWVLIELTPEAAAQQTLARIKGQMGGELPAGLAERLRNRNKEMKAAGDDRLVSSTVQRMAYATIMTTLSPDTPFRGSRVEDMARSPLPDWIDIGLASYAVGGPGFNVRFLREHIEEAFPLEDVLTISRPFVAPDFGGSGGGGPAVFVQAAPGGGGGGDARMEAQYPPPGAQSGATGGNRTRGGGAMTLSKDVQDRMMFDAEASSFFSYLIEKAGVEKVKEIVRQCADTKDSLDVLTQSGAVDKDIEKVEQDWQSWFKDQKADGPPGNVRFSSGPGDPQAPPQ
jgi:hypothetical protein